MSTCFHSSCSIFSSHKQYPEVSDPPHSDGHLTRSICFSQFNVCVVIVFLIMILICITLMTNDSRLVCVHIYSLVKCLLNLFTIFIDILNFLLNFWEFLYFGHKTLSDLCFVNTFSQSMGSSWLQNQTFLEMIGLLCSMAVVCDCVHLWKCPDLYTLKGWLY